MEEERLIELLKRDTFLTREEILSKCWEEAQKEERERITREVKDLHDSLIDYDDIIDIVNNTIK